MHALGVQCSREWWGHTDQDQHISILAVSNDHLNIKTNHPNAAPWVVCMCVCVNWEQQLKTSVMPLLLIMIALVKNMGRKHG